MIWKTLSVSVTSQDVLFPLKDVAQSSQTRADWYRAPELAFGGRGFCRDWFILALFDTVSAVFCFLFIYLMRCILFDSERPLQPIILSSTGINHSCTDRGITFYLFLLIKSDSYSGVRHVSLVARAEFNVPHRPYYYSCFCHTYVARLTLWHTSRYFF